MPVTFARTPADATVHETGGEGRVRYPCRVTKITAHWCTPAEIEPTGAAVPPLEVESAPSARR